MNISIDKILFKLLYIIIITKAIGVLLFFYLPKSGIEKINNDSESLYFKYNFINSFNLQNQHKIKRKKPIIKADYKLNNLTLIGVFISSENTFILVENSTKEKIFINQNSYYKGYLLSSVEPNRAVFQKNNKNYYIELKTDKNINQAIRTSIQPISLPGASVNDNNMENSVKFVKRSIISKYKNDYSAIVKGIGFEDVIQNRRLKGFKVTRVKRGSIFEKFGLRVGDIITAVNGTKIKSYSQVMKMYKKIDKINSLKITIKRDNQEQELEYEVY